MERELFSGGCADCETGRLVESTPGPWVPRGGALTDRSEHGEGDKKSSFSANRDRGNLLRAAKQGPDGRASWLERRLGDVEGSNPRLGQRGERPSKSAKTLWRDPKPQPSGVSQARGESWPKPEEENMRECVLGNLFSGAWAPSRIGAAASRRPVLRVWWPEAP